MDSEDVSIIIGAISIEIGIDASYYRKDKTRLYLSGVEIAMIIASGVFGSFLTGMLKGVQKRLSKYGEDFGERLVDEFIDRISKAKKTLSQINEHDTDQIASTLSEINNDFSLILGADFWLRVLPDARSFTPSEIDEVSSYLRDIGYATDTMRERAEELVTRIQNEIDNL